MTLYKQWSIIHYIFDIIVLTLLKKSHFHDFTLEFFISFWRFIIVAIVCVSHLSSLYSVLCVDILVGGGW